VKNIINDFVKQMIPTLQSEVCRTRKKVLKEICYTPVEKYINPRKNPKMQESTLIKPHPSSEDKTELSQFFERHPDLFKRYRTCHTPLIHTGKMCWKAQEKKLHKLQTEEKYLANIKQKMFKETGMLAILEQMLEAAENKNKSRWELFHSYLENLIKESNAAPIPPEIQSIPETDRELALALDRQFQQISKLTKILTVDKVTVDKFKNLLSVICRISSEDFSEDWFVKSGDLLYPALENLEPEVQKALFEQFPNLEKKHKKYLSNLQTKSI